MPGDVWRLTDVVTVPDVVGPPLAHARNVAHDAGVVLAQPDSDGPPLGALSWPGEYLVTGQSPATRHATVALGFSGGELAPGGSWR